MIRQAATRHAHFIHGLDAYRIAAPWRTVRPTVTFELSLEYSHFPNRAKRDAAFQEGIEREKRLWEAHYNSQQDPHVQIAIDCAYDATKSQYSTAASLVSQILLSIGANRRAERPVKLWVTQWPIEVAGKSKLEHWRDERFQLEDQQNYPQQQMSREEIAQKLKDNAFPPFITAILQSDSRFTNSTTPSKSNERTWSGCLVDPRPLEQIFLREKLIYLTPDSPNVLTHIDTNSVYVIGGLVDRTVVPGVSLSRARALGVRTVRLPVRECLGPISKGASLNVDTVFRALLECAHRQSEAMRQDGLVSEDVMKSHWRLVLQKFVPPRYWQHNTQKGRGKKVDTRSACVKASMPPLLDVSLSGSSQLRKQEMNWMFQLDRRKLTVEEMQSQQRGAEQTIQ